MKKEFYSNILKIINQNKKSISQKNMISNELTLEQSTKYLFSSKIIFLIVTDLAIKNILSLINFYSIPYF